MAGIGSSASCGFSSLVPTQHALVNSTCKGRRSDHMQAAKILQHGDRHKLAGRKHTYDKTQLTALGAHQHVKDVLTPGLARTHTQGNILVPQKSQPPKELDTPSRAVQVHHWCLAVQLS